MTPETVLAITSIAAILGALLGAVLGAGVAWGRSAARQEDQRKRLDALSRAISSRFEIVGKALRRAVDGVARTSTRLDTLTTRLEMIATAVAPVVDHETRLVLLERANGKGSHDN